MLRYLSLPFLVCVSYAYDRRALAEAEARRKAAEPGAAPPVEIDGRAGPEPVRYGDWEVKGIASDF